MVSKVNSVAAEFRKVSDLQMVETTKRTIRENVSISQQLGKMSEKTMTLLRENEALRMKERELGRRVELLENSDREINRKNVSNQKVMVMLQEKVMEQERELVELRHRAAQCGVLERQAREAMQHAASATSDSKVNTYPVLDLYLLKYTCMYHWYYSIYAALYAAALRASPGRGG